MTQFFSLLTDIGLAQIANSQLDGTEVLITEIAVGDGLGLDDGPFVPSQDMTKLVSERWRGPVLRRAISPTDPSVLEVEGRIPPEEGGFTIREVGLFNADGDLVVIGNLPETYKPVLAEGAALDTLVKVLTFVENADNITLKLDPGIIMASKSWVTDLLMERDLSIATAQMMAARNILDGDLRDTKDAARDARMDALAKDLSRLTFNQHVISDRASRAVLN